MREAEKGDVVVDKNTLIQNRPSGGHILWRKILNILYAA